MTLLCQQRCQLTAASILASLRKRFPNDWLTARQVGEYLCVGRDEAYRVMREEPLWSNVRQKKAGCKMKVHVEDFAVFVAEYWYSRGKKQA